MNFLQLGAKAHQAGDLKKAQECYLKHLSMAPNDPNAKQLLGLVFSATGNPQKAISLMQESLAINPAQPHVLNNLAVCQKRIGMQTEARDNFVRAIQQNPNYLDPYKNLVPLLLDMSSQELAEQWLTQAEKQFPGDVGLLKVKAKLFQDTQNYSKAIELYQQLLVSQPQSKEIKHNLALTFRLSGKPAAALSLYNELEQSGLSQYQFFHNKANALSDLGKQQEAIDYYRKAISVNPGYVESHVNLNELLWETENNQAFLQSYADAFAKVPDNYPLQFSYTATLLRLSQYQQAFDFLEQLAQGAKNFYEYYELTGRALKGLGKIEQAIEQQQQMLSFTDVSAEAMLNFAETLLEDEQPQRAQEVIERALKLEPENKLGWSLLGVAWQMTGDARADVLNDYENLVRVYTIEVPEGFDSVEHFCEELNTYLTSLHTTTRQPLEQTLMGGTQTRGNLFNDQNPLVQALMEKISLCVKDYIKSTEAQMGGLPVIYNTKSFSYSGSWSVRLSGKGYHTPHVHPMGWLSSAFYVQLPETVEDEINKQGWFKLGEPNLKLKTPMEARKYVKPAVGKLVLFQSYMWHGTVPFETDETRTTVAFDIARVNG